MSENVSLKKNESVQVFRALMFIWIFCAHAIAQLRLFNPLHLVEIGVTPFFVLSGFLMLSRHSPDEGVCSLKSCFEAMKKRIFPMYLLHILTTLFIFFVWTARFWHGGVLAERFKDILLVPLFFHSILIQSWCPMDIALKLNAPTWYISTAAFLYFTFPVIKKLICVFDGKKRFVFFLAILSLRFLAEVAILNSFDSDRSFEFFPPLRVADFWIGCLAGNLYRENKKKLCLSNLAFFILQVAAIVLGVLLSFIKPERFPLLIRAFFRCNAIKILLSCVWVYFFIEGKGLLRFLTLAPVVALGNISGTTYLIHWPVVVLQDTLQSFFNVKYENWSAFALYCVVLVEFAVTIILSALWVRINALLRERKAARQQ